MKILERFRPHVLIAVLGVLVTPWPTSALAQGEYGPNNSYPCPTSSFYISDDFAVPTAADRNVLKNFVFGYGNFYSPVMLDRGIYKRTSTYKDLTGQYIWLVGAVGVVCYKTYDVFGSTMWVVWDGRIFGAAYPSGARSCSLNFYYQEYPDETPCYAGKGGVSTAAYPYDGGDGNAVIENPAAIVTTAPTTGGCVHIFILMEVYDELVGYWFWEAEAEYCG